MENDICDARVFGISWLILEMVFLYLPGNEENSIVVLWIKSVLFTWSEIIVNKACSEMINLSIHFM